MAGTSLLLVLAMALVMLESPVRSFLLHESKCQVQPRISTCETCSGSGKNAACRNSNNFGFGKYCFRENVHNSSGLFFTKGVASTEECQEKVHLSLTVQPECNKAVPALGTVCFDCCFQSSCSLGENFCNNLEPIPPKYMPYHASIVHTTKTTTQRTTHLTKTYPTTKSSTKPTSQASVTSSSASADRVCQVCVEQNGVTCTGSDYQTCDVSKPYCMNTLITDTTGSMVVKKCATAIECEFDYWVGTRSDSRCNTTSGFSTEVDLCHYCCQTDDGSQTPCNREKVPSKLASFAPPPAPKKKCIVGDSLLGGRVEECDIGKEFCLNTVLFQTNQAHPIERVSKKCALEAECKGQWWYNSHNRPECLTQNFKNVTSPQFLCHYCCLSDEKGPCNGLDIPNHLYSFDNPTGGR